MSIKEDFVNWLEKNSYEPLIIESGRSTKTLLLKIAKNENFDYLFQQTFYRGTHIERDEQLIFSGMYCKKNGKVYCAYNSLKQTIPDFEWEIGKYEMSEKMTEKVCQMINESVISNPKIYSTSRPICEDSEKYLKNYNSNIAPDLARRNFLAGNYSSEIKYDCRYKFDGWKEENLLEYILDPEKFMDNEMEGYLSANLEDILVDLRANEILREHLQEIENMEDSPLHRVKRIIEAVDKSCAKTVIVTILKDDKELSFKTSANVLHRAPNPAYSRWDIVANDRFKYEELFGKTDYKPEEITEISYRGKSIYSAEPNEPVITDGINQTM